MKIILASQSPRRKEILETLKIDFDIIPSDFEEDMTEFDTSEILAANLAFEKANDVFMRMEHNNDYIVIGADTIVSIDVPKTIVLGKPKNVDEARDMLKMLSDNTHKVTTGVSVVSKDKKIVSYDNTYVTFAKLDDDVIERYLQTGDSLDKAGAYGVQGYASSFIRKINGCFFNVMGLPLHKISEILREFGVQV